MAPPLRADSPSSAADTARSRCSHGRRRAFPRAPARVARCGRTHDPPTPEVLGVLDLSRLLARAHSHTLSLATAIAVASALRPHVQADIASHCGDVPARRSCRIPVTPFSGSITPATSSPRLRPPSDSFVDWWRRDAIPPMKYAGSAQNSIWSLVRPPVPRRRPAWPIIGALPNGRARRSLSESRRWLRRRRRHR